MANLDNTLYGTIKTEFWLGVNAKLDSTGVTAKRDFVFPDKSGTLAMLSDIVSGGITWSTSGTASELVPDAAEIVTAAVDKTLPASVAAGDQFIVHAEIDGVRIVSNGNVISDIGSGNDLTLENGQTAYLVASAANTLEIV